MEFLVKNQSAEEIKKFIGRYPGALDKIKIISTNNGIKVERVEDDGREPIDAAFFLMLQEDIDKLL